MSEPIRKCVAAFLILLGFLVSSPIAYAQDGITLSLTPPFFQLTINPGETWSSSIKVVNVNNFPLTLFATPVNFEATDETGRGKFTPLLNNTPEYLETTLAGWIDVTDGPIIVESGESVRVPFTINAPENAPPGGHFAAILVGTEPVRDAEGGPYVSVSSLISSLIFARVAGDVVERGDIRELSTDGLFYQTAEVPITLRFENLGNVHILPQGDITIYNMWGKERGKISINQRTEFGNVLPETIRKFSYKWTGEDSPLEAGRYKAVATLSFGDEERQNVTRTTSFWVIPVAPALTILGSFVLLILLITWFIKRYIRRALGVHIEATGQMPSRKANAKTLAQPLVDGVMDLRNVGKPQEAPEKMSFGKYMASYKLFFVFIVFIILAWFLVSSYFGEVLEPERTFEVEDLNPDLGAPLEG